VHEENYSALLAHVPGLYEYKDSAELLLATPEEQEVWPEEETCSWLLLDTEAPGTPEKKSNGAYHRAECSVTTSMEPLAETASLMPENPGQPLKQRHGHPQKIFLASTLHRY
jgi:hypothetical protein